MSLRCVTSCMLIQLLLYIISTNSKPRHNPRFQGNNCVQIYTPLSRPIDHLSGGYIICHIYYNAVIMPKRPSNKYFHASSWDTYANRSRKLRDCKLPQVSHPHSPATRHGDTWRCNPMCNCTPSTQRCEHTILLPKLGLPPVGA